MKPRDPEKEQALFDAALRVADREGLDTLTVQKVAREAGLAVGTVYVYFEGKEDLLRRLYLRSKGQAGEQLMVGFRDDMTFDEAFALLGRNQFAYLVDHRLETGFQAKFYRSGFADDQTRALSRSYTDGLEALIRRGQAEGQVGALEPAEVLRYLLAVFQEAAKGAAGLDTEGRTLAANRAIAFCRKGLAP